MTQRRIPGARWKDAANETHGKSWGVTEVAFHCQAIFVAADYEHETLQRLPIFRSWLSTTLAIDVSTSLRLFCVLLDERYSASLSRASPRRYRALLRSVIAALHRLLY